jgi:hypothetical protein
VARFGTKWFIVEDVVFIQSFAELRFNSTSNLVVEDCDSRITNENDDDESGSWTEVVSKKKKKTDGFLTTKKKKKTDGFLTTNLGGKQSEKRFEKLTLFTKSN